MLVTGGPGFPDPVRHETSIRWRTVTNGTSARRNCSAQAI